MYNFQGRHLFVLFPAYHSGHFIKTCFMLHDAVAGPDYQLHKNKVQSFKAQLTSDHQPPDKSGVVNAHYNKIIIDENFVEKAGYCEYNTHAWHRAIKEPFAYDNRLPLSDDLITLFNNTSVIIISPDCDVLPNRREIAGQPEFTKELYKFWPGEEIWYIKRFNTPYVYMNYSDILSDDTNNLTNKIMEIGEKFDWPMADKKVINDYIDLYHAAILS